MIGIIVDSGCDLPEAIKEKTNVRVIPLKVVLEGKEYRDNIDITTEQRTNFPKLRFPVITISGRPLKAFIKKE